MIAFLLVFAQQTAPDVIRGRVTDDSSRAVVATVTVTRGPDRLVQQATTDSAGNFRIRFEEGTGDYLVHVSATGFNSARRRVQREADERELTANFILPRAEVATLDAVKIEGRKPARARNPVGPMQTDPGSPEKWRDGVEGQVPPTLAGDLNAIAGTMSNVTVTGSGPAILGSGAESNLNTLNGMGLATGSIPRAARTETRVTGATFDPTRGGFSGANIDVRLGPGDRFYQRRNAFLTLDPRFLQFTDATGRSLGAATGGARGSVGADGELIRDALTYNVSLEVGRSVSNPPTLLDADAQALLSAGIAPDSVARLIALATPLGLPISGLNVPSNRAQDAVTWLGRLDDTRDTLSTRALTSYAGFTREGALGFGPLSAPAAASEKRERTLGAQLTLGSYVGPGRRILNETRIALSGVSSHVTPYQSLPGATVTVRSDNVDAGIDVSSLLLTGGAFPPAEESRWTLEAGNQTEWNARGRTHRFKGLLWGRMDGLSQDGFPNGLGTFTFNSIEDFAASRATSFSRTLSEPSRNGRVWNAATALAHTYGVTRYFNMIYGARLEADGFASAPPRNAALEQALGVSTGAAPSRLHLSPRAGFTWTYNRDKENGQGTMQNQTGRYYRTMSGTIRGGIGEFRDLLRPGLLADASAATGLSGATSVLSCVGAAVPTPDWSLFSSDPGSIPTQCLDGSGVLAERAPAVTLIDPSYDVPRSWRASLDWNTSVKNWLLRVGTLVSYDLSQPGAFDANFGGTTRLTLADDEANRPVFVSAAAIDAVSGSVSPVESRRSDQYGRVGVRVSDLRGYGGQLNVALSPDVFKFRGGASFYGSVAYTLQATKRQYRGFDGAAFGDPRPKEWAAGPNDARHVWILSSAFSTSKIGTVTMFARAQSGLPFTPLVQGDVNGDSRGGDRAYIPDPDEIADATLAGQLQALLDNGSKPARRCLLDNLGEVAPRNGCRGPWTQSLNIQWRPPMPRRWARVTPNVYLQNVLAGFDQMLHGSDLRGWGSQAAADPVLLVPRGFDAANARFRYDVNPRFADTRPGRTQLRNPFRVVIDFNFQLSTPFDLQQLRRAVEPVRGPAGAWRRRSADSLAAFYLSRTSDLYRMLIKESDSLLLTSPQIAALQRADSVYSGEVRALYIPLGEYLARGEGAAGKAELDSAKATQKSYWKVFWRQPEIASEILTPVQRELLPMIKRMVSIPQKERETSQWQFGHPIPFSDKANPPRQ